MPFGEAAGLNALIVLAVTFGFVLLMMAIILAVLVVRGQNINRRISSLEEKLGVSPTPAAHARPAVTPDPPALVIRIQDLEDRVQSQNNRLIEFIDSTLRKSSAVSAPRWTEQPERSPEPVRPAPAATAADPAWNAPTRHTVTEQTVMDLYQRVIRERDSARTLLQDYEVIDLDFAGDPVQAREARLWQIVALSEPTRAYIVPSLSLAYDTAWFSADGGSRAWEKLSPWFEIGRAASSLRSIETLSPTVADGSGSTLRVQRKGSIQLPTT